MIFYIAEVQEDEVTSYHLISAPSDAVAARCAHDIAVAPATLRTLKRVTGLEKIHFSKQV